MSVVLFLSNLIIFVVSLTISFYSFRNRHFEQIFFWLSHVRVNVTCARVCACQCAGVGMLFSFFSFHRTLLIAARSLRGSISAVCALCFASYSDLVHANLERLSHTHFSNFEHAFDSSAVMMHRNDIYWTFNTNSICFNASQSKYLAFFCFPADFIIYKTLKYFIFVFKKYEAANWLQND